MHIPVILIDIGYYRNGLVLPVSRPCSIRLVLVPIASDGSERSGHSTAALGDGLSPGLLPSSPASRSVGDDGDDASPGIAIAPCCTPTGLAHSPVIVSVHEHYVGRQKYLYP